MDKNKTEEYNKIKKEGWETIEKHLKSRVSTHNLFVFQLLYNCIFESAYNLGLKHSKN